MVVMSTQLIGFSIGGILRRFLVQPPSMSETQFCSKELLLKSSLLLVWPANLVNCALFNTLHSQTYAGIGTRGGISRERFFTYAFVGSVLWYFFPGYIFQALSVFSWVCWIAPNNVVRVGGYHCVQNGSAITENKPIVWIFFRTRDVTDNI